MKRYQCIKQVKAAKILDIKVIESGSCKLDLEGFGSEYQTAAWYRKHSPQTGGYYVIYDGGYISYSPAKPFEEGYIEISE